MKKIILVNGLIGGIIVSAVMATAVASGYSGAGGMIIGYASMLIAFSLIFVGIKNYRDKYNDGFISFGKAFKIGVLITLIASTLYVATWLIEYFFFIPDFGDKYASEMVDQLKASGASQADLDKKTKEMADFASMYKNPFFNALITYTEILPVGLIVTIISALILKKKSTVTVA